jgi:uncharacterized protein YdeI (YjbR/CyaY-like superfamily)
MTTDAALEKAGLPIIAFESGDAFAAWLLQHHADTPGVWVLMYKKHTGRPSVAWAEAVIAALRYGWIDSVANKYDDDSYIQKFTPRRARSIWSKKNCQTAERLISEDLMHPAGLAEVERAKADGRWEAAYESSKDMQVPQDFLDELEKYPEAKAFYASLNRANTYAIAFRLTTAKKPETRARRFEQLIAMMREGKKLH